jgi:protein FAM50
MADGNSRFTSQSSQGQTTQERLSTNTVGLVAFSDYRKRRADVLEQQEREAREAALLGTSTSTPGSGNNSTGNNTPDPAASDSGAPKQPLKKKLRSKKKQGKSLLSFDNEDEDGEDLGSAKVKPTEKNNNKKQQKEEEDGADKDGDGGQEATKKSKFAANTSVTVVPKAMTKAALLREAAERESLRKEFLVQREAVKAAEIAIPFVFYDGSNIPGGVVRAKKGDFVWLFLDKSRKVGAERATSGARRAWARVGVDDLMMVRGTIIIPHVSLIYGLVSNRLSLP